MLGILQYHHLLGLKGRGGDVFREFVDQLIHAEAALGGLTQSEIDTQLRSNVADKGVDAAVHAPVPRDRSGFLASPTCWQYKAVEADDLKGTKGEPYRFLTDAIGEPAVVRRLLAGSRFVFCLLGDLTPEKYIAWEAHLAGEASRLGATGAAPIVVAGDKLCAWASRFPAIISRLVGIPHVLNLGTKLESCRAVTSTYVRVREWDAAQARVLAFVGLGDRKANPCLAVQGVAGVGKTRFVCEVLSNKQLEGLIVYTVDDAKAIELCERIAAIPEASAIVIADECPAKSRLRIQDCLAGCPDRIRVLCIDNTGVQPASGEPEIWLEKIPKADARAILDANFPVVPRERRNAYVDLAEGFIRFAADMCRNDATLAATGLAPALNSVEDYIRVRLTDPMDALVLDALALFPRVGARGELAAELDSLCTIVGPTPAEVHQSVEKLKDSPGFVNVAGRTYYVTPQIVAQVAFMRGWNRWVKHDVTRFLDRLEPSLAEAFIERAKEVGSDEVRRAIAARFRDWLAALTPACLRSVSDSRRLAQIVESDPDTFAPYLASLLERATHQELTAISGTWTEGSWGSRRALVWLLERLVAFQRHFADAEASLYRLAVAESEPDLGNNATESWQGLFRMFLSGTEVPFTERFDLLRRRMSEARNDLELDLVFGALGAIITTHSMRMGRPPTLGGRLLPPDWQPSTRADEAECWSMTIRYLTELVEQPATRERATNLLLKNFYLLARLGFLTEIRGPFTMVEAGLAVRLVAALDLVLDLEARHPNDAMKAEDLDLARTWRDQLAPKDVRGRIRALVSRSMFDRRVRARGGEESPELASLAEDALDARTELMDELDWLSGDEAHSAGAFGEILGKRDRELVLLEAITVATLAHGRGALLRGYVHGAIATHGVLPPALEASISRVLSEAPRVGFELLVVAGDRMDAIPRSLRLVDEAHLPPEYLRYLWYSPSIVVGLDSYERILGSLRAFRERPTVRSMLLDLAFTLSKRDAHAFDDPRALSIATEALAAGLDTSDPMDAFHWLETAKSILESKPEAVVGLMVHALGKGAHRHPELLDTVTRVAAQHPSLLMSSLGTRLLEEDAPIALAFTDLRRVIAALPEEVVSEWLAREGLEGARRLAQHVPSPYVDEARRPVVPGLTLHLLEKFGDDAVVFRRFVEGTADTEAWWGDGTERFLAQAATTRLFLTHPNAHIRRWANLRAQEREASAARERLRHEEDLESAV